MKIVILGWGSLIWNPKTLKHNKTFGWQIDGPILPLEFARISKDGRLTLVITENGTKVQTLYTISCYSTVEDAVLNLKLREGNKRTPVGFYNKRISNSKTKNGVQIEAMKSWLKDKKDFDAVIWTDLGEKWESEEFGLINPNERIEYLKKLTGSKAALAQEYIRKTPAQIDTKYRKLIERDLNWQPIIT